MHRRSSQKFGKGEPDGFSILHEVGATVVCSYCGAPNASPGFDKLIIFYCARCGNSVEVKEPPVN
jgi:DNA-directed RNA polymerase subunit RPC12/RpoP